MSLENAVRILVFLVVAFLVFAAFFWLADFMALPAPMGHALKCVIIVLAVLVGVYALLKIAKGQPPIT